MNYSTTGYSATGGANGGGFMAGSQGEGAEGKSKSAKDSLRPVTIKQLHDAHHPYADSEHFMIDDAETIQVTFVAQIRNISAQATNHTYRMDDGTGTIEAKVWVDADLINADSDNPLVKEREKLVEGSYARVFGRLKEFNNKRHVGANIIRPISDFNEIQYHLLEATYIHLLSTRGPAGGQTKGGAANGVNGKADGGSFNDGQQLPAGVSQHGKRVWHCLRTTPQQNEGLHAQNIASRTNMDINDVLKGSDELVSYGLIYTTVDEHTWAIMDV